MNTSLSADGNVMCQDALCPIHYGQFKLVRLIHEDGVRGEAAYKCETSMETARGYGYDFEEVTP